LRREIDDVLRVLERELGEESAGDPATVCDPDPAVLVSDRVLLGALATHG
jgi:hypothetical protein